MDINNLYKLASGGDKGAENRLFESLSARFRLFIRQRINDSMDGEEVCQDALKTITEQYRSVSIEASFSAWCYKILEHKMLDFLRRKQRTAVRFAPMNETRERSLGKEASSDIEQRLLACLKKIGIANKRYARMLNLNYQGYSTGEICKRLKLTSSNFYTILSRSRTLLANCLAGVEQ